jgi:tetratricopeptide (TPR) repeat protein
MAPTILPLDEAIGEIAQACPTDPLGGTARPFVFVVGAGISFPPVPLAGDIETKCKELAEKRGVKPLPGSPSAMERYSHWFGKAYSQPILRQQFLESLIEGKEISLANFRLAHLLRAKCVANMVITPNFDNFLSRALATFGHDTFRVCDHPQTVDRISQQRPEIQIVHVHGNHWSYDQANLTGELEDRAQQLATTTSSMALLLDAIFRERSPLVVGYSGWEGDVIMKALFRRHSYANGYRSYWFCHRRTDIDSLPLWLKSRQDLAFVLPPEPQQSDRPVSTETSSRTAGVNIANPAERAPAPRLAQAPIAEAGERSDRLMASTVFDRLIVALGAESPPLFSDPLEFFARRLEESVPKDMRVPGGAGAYSLGDAIEQIRRAQKSLIDAEKTAGKTQEAETLLAEVREAIRGSRYEDALNSAARISVSDLGETGRRGLVEGLSLATQNVDPKSESALHGSILLIETAKALSKTSPTVELDLTIAEAVQRKAFILLGQDRYQDAVDAFDELARNFEESSVVPLQELAARALYNKGVALGKLKGPADAIVVYKDLVERFGTCAIDEVQDCVASALVNSGVALGRLDRGDEAMNAYDEVVRRFGDSSFAPLKEQVAKALYNKGLAHWKRDRGDDAIKMFNELIQRFGDTPLAAVQEQVAWGLYNKGVALGALDRGLDAISAYDELVLRIGDSSTPAMQELAAWSLYNRALAMGSMGRPLDSIAGFDDLVRRFGDSSAVAIQESVAWALYNKGVALGTLTRIADAIITYDELVRRFGDSSAVAVQEPVAWALYNKGYALDVPDHSDDAIAAYDDLIRRFGTSSIEAVLDPLAKALLNKGSLFAKLERNEEAVGIYDDVVRRFEGYSSAVFQERVANALAEKADILVKLGQQPEAAKVLDQAIQMFGESTESSIAEIVEKVKTQRSGLSGV